MYNKILDFFQSIDVTFAIFSKAIVSFYEIYMIPFYKTYIVPLFDTISFKYLVAIIFIIFCFTIFHNESFSKTETKRKELEKVLAKRETKKEKNKEIN